MDHTLSSTVHARRAAASEEGFSFRRLALVAGLDLRENLRRPLFLIWAAFMTLNGWWMSRGNWVYRSIDTSLGGPKAWVDSEFQITYVFALAGFFFIAFFVAVASGTPLVRDEELNVGRCCIRPPCARASTCGGSSWPPCWRASRPWP